MSYESRESRIREWFSNHVAREIPAASDGDELWLCRLSWRRPDSSHCAIEYVILGRTLFVTGDLGSAVYVWPQRITFEWLANCGLGYFASKCEASEAGIGYREWSCRNAKLRMESLLCEDGRSLVDVLLDHDIDYSEAEQACDNEFAWYKFWSENDSLGVDLCDVGSGKIVNLRCQSHLVGLMMAVDQIRLVNVTPSATTAPTT